MDDREFFMQLSREMADRGRLIEAGWISLRAMAIPPNAPPVQINGMRNAFMAGAQHLFSSIMIMLEADEEPTEKDMRRLDLIRAELDKFGEELKARLETKGPPQ